MVENQDHAVMKTTRFRWIVAMHFLLCEAALYFFPRWMPSIIFGLYPGSTRFFRYSIPPFRAEEHWHVDEARCVMEMAGLFLLLLFLVGIGMIVQGFQEMEAKRGVYAP